MDSQHFLILGESISSTDWQHQYPLHNKKESNSLHQIALVVIEVGLMLLTARHSDPAVEYQYTGAGKNPSQLCNVSVESICLHVLSHISLS